MKSTLLRVLALVMVTSLLLLAAGCGPAETPAPAPAEETPVPAPTEEPEPPAAEEEAEAPAETIQLTFWHYWDGHNGETFDALAEEYAAAHPNVEIEPLYIGWSDLLPSLQTAASGGDVPSFAIADMVWMPKLAESGALVELDPYIDASGVDLDDFYSALLNIDRYDGAYLGLPVSTNNLELFYNKELFAAAGLDPEQPPTTWEELKTAAETCADPDNAVVGMELYTEAANEGLTWQFQVYLWQAGADFLTDDYTAAAFNSPGGEQALQFWVDLIEGDGSDLVPWGQFEQGNACMRMDGSWMVGIWANDLTFDFGTAPMPHPADGEPGTNMGGEHIFIFETTPEEQQAAWEFIEWFTSTEVQSRWDRETGFMPIRDSVANDPDYLAWMQDTEPRLAAFIESQQYAHARPSVSNYQELSDLFSAEVQRALYGEASIPEALAAAEEAVNAVLAK